MTELLSEIERDLVMSVMAGTHLDIEMSELDVSVLNDESIAGAVRQGQGPALLEVLEKVLTRCADDEELRRSFGPDLRTPVAPEGRGALRWLSAMRERVAAVVNDPTLIPSYPYQDRTGFEPPRASRWAFDDPTLDAVATLVDQLESWMAEPHDDTWYRRHFLVDVGRSIGRVAPVVSHDLGDDELWDHATLTSVVSIGVERLVRRPDRDSVELGEVDLREWAVVYSRPELPLDLAVRQRFPDLVQLFGGYLGQPFGDQHGWPQRRVADLMQRTQGSARDRMRAQLAELLTIESDGELVATVGHLGSYCLPYYMRHWIDRLHWKIDALDWGPPVVPRDD